MEIERKFLLRDSSWRASVCGTEEIIQDYLANTDRGSIRVRLAGERATLNLKSMTLGVTRSEFDYVIPAQDARIILATLCLGPPIRKTRHHVEHDGHLWEIDEFHGENAGLVVAELELGHAEEPFTRPPWLGEEVSDDPRYYNICLMEHPYRDWK